MSEEIERLNYYQLQFLGAEDFKAEQVYHRDMRRRHNLGQHTWGIVTGLELKEEARAGGGFDMYVWPGLAVDGFGREIVAGSKYKLDASDFRFVKGKKASIHTVHIAFLEEQATPPAFGYGSCDADGQNDRVRELFRIVIDADQPTHAPIRIDGSDANEKALPQDLSIPYQELPDSGSTRWLIPLGKVQWDPVNQVFVIDSDSKDLKKQDRVYAGVVAEDVIAPAGELVFRPREVPEDVDAADFAKVEGRLEVEGELHADRKVVVDGNVEAKNDVVLWGGKLSFATAKDANHDGNADDDGAPLTMERFGKYDLRIRIGSGKTNRLTISTEPPVSQLADYILAVSGDDRVHIPAGTLHFGDIGRQMLVLRDPPAESPYAIGVQKDTLYSRSHRDFSWFRRGTHVDDRGDPGTGGTLAMRLNDSNVLSIFGPLTADSLQATKGDVFIDGGKLQLRGKNGDTGSDELALTRYQHVTSTSVPIPNSYDLRVIIGDDMGGDDAFTIGPVDYNDGQYKEQFKVTNDGHVTAAGSLSVLDGVGGTPKFKVTNLGDVTAAGSLTVQKATMSGLLTASGGLTVTGNTQLQSLDVSGQVNTSGGDLTVGGNIVLTAPHAITYGTVRYPFDVVAGETPTAFGPGTYTTSLFTVQSGLPQITNASIHVALAATKGSAVNGQWSVTVNQLSVTTQLNAVKFALDLKIAAGCSIDAVSYLVIFTP